MPQLKILYKLSGFVPVPTLAYATTFDLPTMWSCSRLAAVGIAGCQGDRGSATIGDDSSFIMAEVFVPLNRAHSPPYTAPGSLN